MENKSIFQENEKNKFILVYPPIRQLNDFYDTQQYLSIFSKGPKRSSFLLPQDETHKIKNRKRNNSIEIESKKDQYKQKNINESEKYNCYLINKDFQLKNNKLKRTTDIKQALENFLRKSDLIEKITKFFEELRDNFSKIKKSKIKNKKEKKGDNSKIEEENEKNIEKYIDSIITKLADNVVFEKYTKNEFIMKMNDIGDNCYFLVSGKLSVLKPVEYNIEISYDDYIQYISNLIKNNEYDLIETMRHLNQNFIDIGLVEDLKDFIKSYFIIKLNRDINNLLRNNIFDVSFIKRRFDLFNLSFENYNLSSEKIYNQINIINKGSLLKERDLKDYLMRIITPKQEDFLRLSTNPHIFEDGNHKATIYKYEEFLYLKPGSFFGETALDSIAHKRNASIRAEEDCIILSLKNKIYKFLLSESNKKLKSFDVIFICKNFFFNNISHVIFNRHYFSLFKLIHKAKDDILYKQSEKLTSLYFIKEGNIKLDIYASLEEINDLIKKYFEILTNNSFLKISQKEIIEIKENFIIDKNLSDVRHQTKVFKDQLKIKRNFEIYTSNLFDILGLEEFFLDNDYLCSCKVISNDAKLFEISKDSLNLIISNEKQIINSFYQIIGRKFISLIKRLNTLERSYINQLNYKIKENFFGTEIPKDYLIKGQTGEKKPFSKSHKKNSELKILKTFNKKTGNEEIKNNVFSFNKYSKCHTRNNKFFDSDLNTFNIKNIENLTDDNFKHFYTKFESINKKDIYKNNALTNLKSYKEKDQLVSNTQVIKNIMENDAELDKETEITKSIMETTIIRVGMDYLSLKQIGNRVKNAYKNNNKSNLSIVNNFYYKTYTNINKTIMHDSFDKKCNAQNKIDQSFRRKKRNIKNKDNNRNEPFSLKKKIMSLTSKNKNLYNNKLPRIPINTYNNFTNLLIKNNINHYNYNKYNPYKIKTNLFKSTKIVNNKFNHKNNYYKTFFDNNKSSFNVILTNDRKSIFKEKTKKNRSKNKEK